MTRVHRTGTSSSWRWIGVAAVGLIVLVIIGALFIDAPLRGYLERQANRALHGYTLSIGSLDFHPIGFSIDLADVVLLQDRNPEQPVLTIPKWSMNVHWRELFTGNLVSEHRFERPSIRISRSQAIDEFEDETELKERGWQDAVLAVYPLEVNHLTITDGDVTYEDSPDSPPLRLQSIQFWAENIRNVESEPNEYPSPIRLEGRIFGSGHLRMKGRADFLAKPQAAVDADFNLERAPLNDLLALSGRYNMAVRQGQVSAQGRMRSTASEKTVDVTKFELVGLQADFLHSADTALQERRVVTTVSREAKAAHNESQMSIMVHRGEITDATIGFVNRSSNPQYRVFISQLNVQVDNYSNRLEKGSADVALNGRFMGSGELSSSGTFRSHKSGPDFDLRVKIIRTKLTSMNDLLRAYGGVDAKAGQFSFFSEVTVQDGKMNGYIKPLFKDVEVYDPTLDSGKNFFRQVYEGLVQSLIEVFKNTRRNEVATETSVSGPLSNPEADTWQVLLNLVKNAFFHAILPGFKQRTA